MPESWLTERTRAPPSRGRQYPEPLAPELTTAPPNVIDNPPCSGLLVKHKAFNRNCSKVQKLWKLPRSPYWYLVIDLLIGPAYWKADIGSDEISQSQPCKLFFLMAFQILGFCNQIYTKNVSVFRTSEFPTATFPFFTAEPWNNWPWTISKSNWWLTEIPH